MHLLILLAVCLYKKPAQIELSEPGSPFILLSSLGRLQDRLRQRRWRQQPGNSKRIYQAAAAAATTTTIIPPPPPPPPPPLTKTTPKTIVEWKVEENDTVTIPCYGLSVHKDKVL